jgi:hypothetical protein
LRQFIPFWNILQQTENHIKPVFIIWTPFFLSVTGSTAEMPHDFVNGQTKKWFGFTLMENTDAEELLGRI